jgi:hypothetical protein
VAARRAARLLAADDRRRAALFACRASALGDAARRPSRFNAAEVARDRFGLVRFRGCRPARLADAAL